MNYKVIFHTLGWVLIIEAICMVPALLCSAIYKESLTALLIGILISLLVGFLLTKIPGKKKEMYAKEGFVTVALSWIVMGIFGAIPFVVSGHIPNIFDAVFETVSGFTTTGASILSDLDSLPRGLIFWRSFTHWMGGMGVIVFLVALLPLSGGSNVYLLKAESPGPDVGKIVPKVKKTAMILYGIYVSLTVVQIIILLISKMPIFDALTLSFGTAGTGGFAVRNSGFSEYTSFQQWVITIFMILFGVDFSFYYLLLIKKFTSALKMEEVRMYFIIVITAIILISINCYGVYENVSETIKHSAFQVGAIITTTGYSTTDFDLWPEFSKMILILLMFVGACAGSTGGGIKVSRIMIFFKSIIKELRIIAHPKRTHKITMNGRIVEHEIARGVSVYMMAYLIIFAASVLVVSFDNFGFTTNFTGVLATINNIGPGLDGVGPTRNFGMYSNLSKVVFSLDMLFGRLEIFPMLVLFAPNTWRK